MKIHPTAVVDAGAALGHQVEIGPFAVIGAGAKIGDDCVIQTHVVIEGMVQIGRGNVIGHGSVIGGMPQDRAFQPQTQSEVRIGNGNVLREHCTIHRGTAEGSATEMGDENFLMAGTHIGHNCRIGNRVTMANNCLLGGHVRIDDGAFLGGGTTFHQNVHVGRLAMTQGMSGFSKDVPPFLLSGEKNFAFGVNMVGLRRAGLSAAERDDVKRAFKLLYRSGLNTQQAIERAAEAEFGPIGREFFAFIANAQKRGIVRYRHAPEAQD